MAFTSLDFLVFFSIILVTYYCCNSARKQLLVLVLGSWFFYGYHIPSFLLLLVASVLLNSMVSFFIKHHSSRFDRQIMFFGVGLNLLGLIFFKYIQMIAGLFFDETAINNSFVSSIVLPIGISFYTFQGISLILEVYNKRAFASKTEFVQKGFLNHLLFTSFYICFFPQLIAGPIVKPNQIYIQVGFKKISTVDWGYFYKMMVLGFFLKVFIADNLNDYNPYIEVVNRFSIFTRYVLAMGYTVQVYADFAGYSFMALGLASAFGYKLCWNFNAPFLSTSFTGLWKRWHISLYSWFYDYVFNPLLLSLRRYGGWSIFLTIIIVFSLSGLWHGANWNYLFWGLIHAFLLILEYFINQSNIFKWLRRKKLFCACFIVLILIHVNLIFRFSSLSDLESFFDFSNQALFGISYLKIEYYIILFSLPVFIQHVYVVVKDKIRFKRTIDIIMYALMAFLVVSNGGLSESFVYFQF